MLIHRLILAALLLLLPLATCFSLRSMTNVSSAGTLHASTTVADAVESAIASHSVTVFSKTYCPYCARAKAALTELDVEFGLYELDTMKDGTEIQAALAEMTGQRTVPNVFVKGKHLGGCDSTLAAIADGSLQKKLLE